MKKYRKALLAILFGGALLFLLNLWFSGLPRGELNFPRFGHSALLLPDGRVFVMGGVDQTGLTWAYEDLLDMVQQVPWLDELLKLKYRGTASPVYSCELFDPKTHIWKKYGTLNSLHIFGYAHLLTDNAVFYGDGKLGSDDGEYIPIGMGDSIRFAERFDINTQVWHRCPLPEDADTGKCVLLKVSETQILKLQDKGDLSGAEAWVYDVSSKLWARQPKYDCPEGFTDIPLAFSLPNGDFVIEDVCTELFDPKIGHWTRIEQADLPLYCAAVLKSGTLLRAGGLGEEGVNKDAFLLNLKTMAWDRVLSMNVPRIGATMTVLQSGKVLVAGGGVASCEIYDPKTNRWLYTGSLDQPRTYHTATLLRDGRVLVVGGMSGVYPYSVTGNSLSTCELYDPGTGLWTPL